VTVVKVPQHGGEDTEERSDLEALPR